MDVVEEFDDTDEFWNQKELDEQEMWERHEKAVESHRKTLIEMKALRENNIGHEQIQSKR